MASLKTITYVFNELASFTDNTDTNFDQLTIDIDDTVLTFYSVTLEVKYQDAAATASNVNRRQLSLRLGAAAYAVSNNTSVQTQSGEQMWLPASANFTSHFNTNWTGSAMTCDARILVDSANGTPILRAATAILRITYSYEPTSSPTQTKTVCIPLNAPRTNLPTSKPGTATATIPALDTRLPEAGKTIHHIAIVVEGNDQTTAVTDMSISMEIDTSGIITFPTHEKALNTAVWFRHAEGGFAFDTSTTHDFYLWASLASCPGLHVYMIVTYSFNRDTTTKALNQVWLPMEFASPAGNSAAEFQRATRQLWIQEPGTITIRESALFLYWDQAAAVAGLNARIGTGSFNAITNAALTVAGGIGAMLRADGIVTLARGKNTLQADVYRTDAADLVLNLCGVWLITYESDVSSQGIDKHNHSVCWNLFTYTGAADNNRITGAITPVIPETNYFINAIGINYQYCSNTTGNPAGVSVQCQRLSGEGGQQWESIYVDIGHTDAEVGIRQCWAQARAMFQRWPGDTAEDRVVWPGVGRKWKAAMAMGANTFDHLDAWITYHGITYTVAGNITDSDAGTVDIYLMREDEGDERALVTSRSGDGAYSFTWYDNTQDVYVTSKDATGNAGRSGSGTATGSP